MSCLPPIGGEVFLFTYLAVREDAMDLYGFYTEEELDFFKLLITVSGIGPKAAMAILSQFSPQQLAVCIAAGDAKAITKAQGVGAKTAQRLVLELKDKLGGLGMDNAADEIKVVSAASANANAADAVEALVAFGYSRSEASVAVGRLDSSLPAEALIREGLKALAKF
ncbi:MAG: Holliday junction branch migration protein RuvA [Clostridia bacterium]|nr:Holliday junction branch migration protein RuvA [Clostridia bacterium]